MTEETFTRRISPVWCPPRIDTPRLFNCQAKKERLWTCCVTMLAITVASLGVWFLTKQARERAV